MSFTRRKFESLSREARHKKVAEGLRELYELMAEAEPECTPEELSNSYHHHLRLAGQQLKEHNLLPRVNTGDRAEGQPPLPICIYLDHLRSAHNVGSIFRTVEAFALGRIVLSEQTPGPENKQVRDAAMGTAEWVEWSRGQPLPGPIIALETVESAVPIYQFDWPETFTLAIGNEEYGCSQEVLRSADHIVQIPLAGRKNSLNVANAFAIVASAIRKCQTGSCLTK